MAYVMTCQLPDFAQGFDHTRKHILLTKDPKRSGSLQYRFEDDGSTVTVPNVPYNQSRATRAGYFSFAAGQREAAADDFEHGKHAEAIRLTPAARKRIADDMRTRASELRAKAAEILASGPADQVA